MKSAMFLVLLFVLFSPSLVSQANAQGPALKWLEANAPLFYQIVSNMDIKIPQNTVATVLVPSDKAIEAFLKGMKLTKQEFLARKGLVDLVLAYHVIPGFQAKSGNDVKKNPTIAGTADVNYILRFYKDAKTNQVTVKDVQDRDAIVAPGAPVVVSGSSISFLPINKVLMSGAYFFNGLDALKHYPQWSDAFALAKKAGWPTNDASSDLTFFVPSNKALQSRMAISLPPAVAKQQLLYHFVAPARFIPNQLKPGNLPTLLKGHDLKVAVNNKPSGVPEVKITPEVGPAAKVVIYNIYAGKGILQGIDANLVAKLSPNTVKERGSAGAHHHRRALQRWGGRGDNGFNQATANSIAASNTQQAIYAAADGNIPVGAATRYGSYQAEAAAAYGSDCWNCGGWRGHRRSAY